MPDTALTAQKVADAQAALDAANAEHAAAVRATAEPRNPLEVATELLEQLVSRFGNHRDLVALLNELKAGLAKSVG